MTADRAALVERVARAIADAVGECGPDWRESWKWHLQSATAAISLIRAETLEEAARVAEYRCGASEWSAETNSGYECAAKEIAANIRALKETKA